MNVLATNLPPTLVIAHVLFAILGGASFYKKDWKFGLLGIGLAFAFWPWG